MKYIFSLAGIFMSLWVTGQTNRDEVALIRSAFGLEKKEVVGTFVRPSQTQVDNFWAIYDEYEEKRMILGNKRIQLLEEYTRTYQTMTPEHAGFWTGEVIKLQKETDKLIETYYRKILKETDPIVATQFYQIEYYILTAIRMKVLEKVSFLGEQD